MVPALQRRAGGLPSVHALLLVVLGSLPHAASWTTISQSRYGAQLEHIKNLYDNTWEHGAMPAQQTLGFLWTVPNDPTSHEGLGAGITWAWDPNLCTRILSQFTEDFFFIPSINCDNLKAAMTRGFASWSDNSVYVSFTDVTEECAKIGQLNENCPLAEIWITTIEGTGDASGAGATQGLTENSRRQLQDSTTDSLVNDTLYIKLQENLGGATTSAAVALPKTLWSWDFRYTSGVRPSKDNVLETVGGTVAFNADLCWYLDSTFCYSFHSVKNQLPSLSAEEVAWIFRGALLLIWGIAAMYLLWQVCHVCARARSHHHANQCQAWSEALHEFSMLGCSLRVILLLAPPIFYLKIFVPCWDCYDFEAAATHEVGHILGLSHPDNVMTSLCTDPAMECGTTPGQNVYSPMFSSGMRLNASTCLKPWQDVEPYEPTLTDPDAVKLSIMKALTQHNPSVCLSEDDLEALNTLYPDCVGSISTPVCNKTPYNIGWLRLTVWLVVPSLICLLLLLCIFTYTQYHQNKKFEHILQRKLSAEDKIGEHKKQADKAEASAHRNKKEKEKVKKELEEHKRDVEKKIEKEVRRRSIVYEARLQELQAYQSTQKSLKANGTRETLGALSESSEQPDGGDAPPALGSRTTFSSEELDAVAKSMPYQRHEHTYKPGTLGYHAENLADNIGMLSNAAGKLARRASSTINSRRSSLGRSGSSVGAGVEIGDCSEGAGSGVAPSGPPRDRRNTQYKARVNRARAGLGHALQKVASSFGSAGRSSSADSVDVGVTSATTNQDAV